MIRKLFALFWLLSGLALAQNTVTGTIVDPNGNPYANGTASASSVVASGQPSTATTPVPTNGAGFFSLSLASKTYIFTICAPPTNLGPTVNPTPKQVCFSSGPIAISATVDITTQLNAVAAVLGPKLVGGSGTPGGLNNSVQFNNAGAFGGVSNAGSGAIVLANGTSQTKTTFDVRDYAFVCDGTTYNTTAAQNLITAAGSAKANVVGVASADCGVGDLIWPANLTLDFSSGWRLKTLTDSTTTPGNGAFDTTAGAAGQCQSDNAFSVCNITVTAPANDTYALVCMRGFSSGAGVFSSNVSTDVVLTQVGSSIAFASITQWALVPNVVAGSHTFTVTFPANLNGACSAIPISGLGPTPYLDGAGGTCSNVTNTTPMSCTGTFQSGSFLLAFGGQHFTAETCTAGSGFTQPAGAVGNSTNVAVLCVQYKNSASAGSTTASQSFNNSPAGGFWSYQVMGLRPSSAVNVILGGVSDPTSQQIFVNATSGAGIIDFTGNRTAIQIQPEWWGASGTASASTNTGALQSAIIGAFGNQNRINGSGLNQFNKTLLLTQQYSINAELQFYHIIGAAASRWSVWCMPGAGITQTASNLRIFDGQSDAYGRFDNCAWNGSAPNTKPLIDLDFDGNHGTDLAPQFIDFYSNQFNGNSLVDTGVLIAKSGGGAQGSNIYCYDCSGIGFTGAVWQIGGNNTGRNAGRFYAFNALAIGWYGGDMQGCPLYGLASYGGGYIDLHGTSFECVSPWGNNYAAVTGSVDFYCEGAQGPCSMDHVRSEDLRLINATRPIVNDSTNTDQSFPFFQPNGGACLAGSSEPLSSYIHGSDLGGDGALYQITVHGTAFSGACQFNGTSSTSTTLTDTSQNVPGALTIGLPVFGETMTQGTTGSTGTLLIVPVSTGTITGSVTSGTIVAGDTVTQSVTTVHCLVVAPAPTGSGNLLVNQCNGTADNSHVWTDGGSGGTYTPTSAPSFSPASPQMLITAATGAPDGTHNWTGGTSGSVYVPSGVPVNQVNFPAFSTTVGAQMQVTFVGGTGIGMICYPITSNTATTITFTQCTSNYANVHTTTADTTSAEIVEPCWQCANITTIGDFTVAKINPIIIGGDNAQGLNQTSACSLNNVQASGGLVICNGNTGQFTNIRNLTVTRADWFGLQGVGANISNSLITQMMEQVQVIRPFSTAPVGQQSGVLWSILGRNGNPNIFNGAGQYQFGTQPIVFSIAHNAGGLSGNDCFLGGRSDRDAGTDPFRNRVELGCVGSGVFGAPAPNGFNNVNQAGSPTQIGGGSSTGSGTPGNIEFWTGSTGASGATVNSGLRQWFIDPSGNLKTDSTNNTAGQIVTSKGSVSAPALVGTGTGTTGIFFNTTNGNQMLFAVAGGAVDPYGISGANGFTAAAGWPIAWSSSTNDAGASGTPDTSANRCSAGILCVGKGNTPNDSTGALKSAGVISGGATFAASGCGNTTLTGGASAGTYVSVTAGSCTVTVTMGNSLTAPHGWICDAHDLTTVADANNVTLGSSTTTTANLVEGTVAANDVIAFKCMGY